MFVVPRPRMLVERVQFALWEQSAVGRRMIAEAEPEQLSGSENLWEISIRVFFNQLDVVIMQPKALIQTCPGLISSPLKT